MTEEEANAWVSAYNRGRCKCGGSPAWVPVDEQLHMADCTAHLNPPTPQPGNEDRHTNTPHDAATDAHHHSDENWDNDTPTRQEIRDEAVEDDE